MVMLLLGCSMLLPTGDGTRATDDSAASTPSGGAPPPMEATRALTRISLDLRGVRPSDAELAAVEADPEALDGMVDTFLVDPRFEDRILALYGELYLTLTDYYTIEASQLGIDDEAGYLESVGEEPLRLLAYLAANDRPYYEIVTADYTVSNEILGAIWPVDYPRGETGWKPVRYTDGRPAAGVLTSTAMWWRYGTTRSNAHRARANVVSRVLLCNDYLTRPIEFDRDIDLTDEDAVSDALSTNPSCVNCHVSLDPLASYFWGFWWYVEDSPVDMSRYHPEREPLWRDYSGVAPGYYGQAGSSLADLARQIANDPRLPDCAVEQGFELLLRRESGLDDTARLLRHRDAFLDGGLTLRALYRTLVTDPDYRAGAFTREGSVPTKLATPDLLASQVEDLTGYRWTFQEYDMLRTDEVGLRTLAGGADGVFVTSNAALPTATMLLVQKRLAELAAAYAVDREEREEAAGRRLFTASDFRERPGEDDDAVVAQIRLLYRRVLSVERADDDPEVLAALDLWKALAAESSAADAWTGVLTALLRDPDLLLY